MARRKSEADVPEFTDDAGARAAEAERDRPLSLTEQIAGPGPRDALVDPNPVDFIPGVDEKGYHTGLVRQPAEPIVDGSGNLRGFRSETPSKFGYGSLRHLKDAHKDLDSQPAYAGIPTSREDAFDTEKLAKSERAAAKRGPARPEPEPVAATVDAPSDGGGASS